MKKVLTVLTVLILLVTSNVFAQTTNVIKTGQTECFTSDNFSIVIPCAGTGHDAEFQIGVTVPTPRFTDNGDGTVTDNVTQLMWIRNANVTGVMSWQDALDYTSKMSFGGGGLCDPSCGEIDPDCYLDWRLPNINELASLIDYSHYGPALLTGHPFVNVVGKYWSSSTTVPSDPVSTFAWTADMRSGVVSQHNGKGGGYYVWAVRSVD